MLRASYCRYVLNFKEIAITSRARMKEKETFFVRLYDDEHPEIFGVGECPLFRGLSAEDSPEYENILRDCCRQVPAEMPNSSIAFGFESATFDLLLRINRLQFSDFSVPINGLVWMGDRETMYERLKAKLEVGFRCVKLKIGGIDFEEELSLLKYIRSRVSAADVELRLDANGAFTPQNALKRLEQLAKFDVHSIEQPIRQHQPQEMRQIIEKSPIPIALDEELIGMWSDEERAHLLDELHPHFVVLKPSLCGGFISTSKWIKEAQNRNIGWWVTSALESNVGLTAIALYLKDYNVSMPQGLGTGGLYTNNFDSPLTLEGDNLIFHADLPLCNPDLPWISV